MAEWHREASLHMALDLGPDSKHESAPTGRRKVPGRLSREHWTSRERHGNSRTNRNILGFEHGDRARHVRIARDFCEPQATKPASFYCATECGSFSQRAP